MRRFIKRMSSKGDSNVLINCINSIFDIYQHIKKVVDFIKQIFYFQVNFGPKDFLIHRPMLIILISSTIVALDGQRFFMRHTEKIICQNRAIIYQLAHLSDFSLYSKPKLSMALRFILPLGSCDYLTKAHHLTRTDQTHRVRRPEHSPSSPTKI